MKKQFVGINAIGEFVITSGSVEITDPCYSPGDGVIVDNVQNGNYLAFTEITDEGEWGGRNSTLYIINKDYYEKNNTKPESISLLDWQPQSDYFGVDSGQGGIFDKKQYLGGENELFYDSCCNITLEGLGAGTLEFGVVSSSGYGDGGYGYEIFTKDSKIIAIKVIFIGDDEEDEDENEEI